MIKEMEITLGKQKLSVFLQNGFFRTVDHYTSPHTHSHTEIHLLIRGKAMYITGGKRLKVGKNQVIVFPSGVFHGGWDTEEDTLRLAFQTSWHANSLQILTLPASVISGLGETIQEYLQTGNATRMGLYLSLVCSYLTQADTEKLRPVTDRAFLISEFFCNHYAQDITLEDLAAALNVSTRQASRLTQRHTGHTFQDALTLYRISTARQLMAETDMTMEQIAQTVGYHSYSGFWKAMKKAQNEGFSL